MTSSLTSEMYHETSNDVINLFLNGAVTKANFEEVLNHQKRLIYDFKEGNSRTQTPLDPCNSSPKSSFDLGLAPSLLLNQCLQEGILGSFEWGASNRSLCCKTVVRDGHVQSWTNTTYLRPNMPNARQLLAAQFFTSDLGQRCNFQLFANRMHGQYQNIKQQPRAVMAERFCDDRRILLWTFEEPHLTGMARGEFNARLRTGHRRLEKLIELSSPQNNRHYQQEFRPRVLRQVACQAESPAPNEMLVEHENLMGNLFAESTDHCAKAAAAGDSKCCHQNAELNEQLQDDLQRLGELGISPDPILDDYQEEEESH